MKNSKRILIASVALMLLSLSFVACKPTNDEMIIGSWVVEKAIANNEADSTTTDVTELYADHLYQFKYAGALSYAYYNVMENSVDTTKGHWSLHDEELMLTILDSTHHVMVKSISDNTMEWDMEGINRFFPEIHHKTINMTLKKQ